MRAKRDIFGLSVTRSVLCVLSALALCLASCKTASQFPIDDAYYRPSSEPSSTSSTSLTSSTSSSTQPTKTTQPTIEYLSVQDTTVTIRIKK